MTPSRTMFFIAFLICFLRNSKSSRLASHRKEIYCFAQKPAEMLLRTNQFTCRGGDDAECQEGTKPREQVAMRGVEGDIAAEAVLGGQRVCLMTGNALADSPVRVDDRGDAVV